MINNKYIQGLLIFILTFILMAILSEFILSLFLESPSEIIKKQNLEKINATNKEQMLYVKTNDETLKFLLKPNISKSYNLRLPNGSIYHYEILINDDGYRDRKYPLTAGKDTFRIIALGDSVTFGSSKNVEDTYSKVLENLLNDRYHKKIEVLNFGVSGYTTLQEVTLMKLKGMKYKPNLVL